MRGSVTRPSMLTPSKVPALMNLFRRVTGPSCADSKRVDPPDRERLVDGSVPFDGDIRDHCVTGGHARPTRVPERDRSRYAVTGVVPTDTSPPGSWRRSAPTKHRTPLRRIVGDVDRYEHNPTGGRSAHPSSLAADHDDTIGGDPPCWAHLDDEPVFLLPDEDERILNLADPGPHGLVACDSDGRVIFWNDAAATILGWSAAEMIGASVEILVPFAERERFWAAFHSHLRAGTAGKGDQHLATTLISRDGREVTVSARIRVLRTDGRFPTRITAVIDP